MLNLRLKNFKSAQLLKTWGANAMRKLSHMLLTIVLFGLLLIFGVLYWFDPVILGRNLGDLWANLLASVIAVLLIDNIIQLSNREKQSKSIDYVKNKLFRICSSLLSGLAPAVTLHDSGYINWTWESLIKKEYNKEDWAYYFEQIAKERTKALSQIRYAINNQQDLLEDELLGELFVLLESLENPDWDMWISLFERKDIWRLKYLSELAVTTSEISYKLLTEYDLLEHRQTSLEKRSKIYRLEKEELLKDYKRLLDQTLRFKTAVFEKIMPELAKKKK